MKFDHTTEWNKHKQKSVLRTETHKIFGYVETQPDHLIQAKRPALLRVQKKENFSYCDFCRIVDHKVKRKDSKQIANT